eukprot:gene33222-40992_t
MEAEKQLLERALQMVKQQEALRLEELRPLREEKERQRTAAQKVEREQQIAHEKAQHEQQAAKRMKIEIEAQLQRDEQMRIDNIAQETKRQQSLQHTLLKRIDFIIRTHNEYAPQFVCSVEYIQEKSEAWKTTIEMTQRLTMRADAVRAEGWDIRVKGMV